MSCWLLRLVAAVLLAGTIMSYAKDSKSTDDDQRIADFNHFVIFDPRNLLACHDFKYIDLKPDPKNESCHSSFWNMSKSDSTAKYVERDGQWHHLAVTWSVEEAGLTKIYWDGLLVASSYSQKTQPLEPGGAFMLGAEQVGSSCWENLAAAAVGSPAGSCSLSCCVGRALHQACCCIRLESCCSMATWT